MNDQEKMARDFTWAAGDDLAATAKAVPAAPRPEAKLTCFDGGCRRPVKFKVEFEVRWAAPRVFDACTAHIVEVQHLAGIVSAKTAWDGY